MTYLLDAHDLVDEDGEDVDVEVCTKCGCYYERTPELAADWRRIHNPSAGETMPQECRRCLTGEGQ